MTPQNGPENHARRLMILFAAVYVAEGLGQMGGVINQGLTLYLLNDQHWTSTQIASFLSILSFPWLIKPLYGIVSDFVPLFGYKRKLYLVIANALAVGGYLSITTMTSPSHIGIALVVTAFGMAISSTLCGAVLVENGKKSGLNGQFVSQQWLWFYIANICAAFIAGQLCQYLPPGTAMHISAFIAATALFAVMIACWFLTNEERAPVNINGLKESLASLWRALRSRTVWIIGVFIFAYYFSPGFGTPLFVHMNLDLHFSQQFIGSLGSVAAFGHIIGAVIYRLLAARLSLKRIVYASILAGAISQASFIMLDGYTSAVVLNLINGMCSMVAVISIFTLAAEYCPDGSEGFTYALLMSMHSAASPLSSYIGAYLYDHTFHHNLTPLILLSAGVTAFSLVLIPLLKLGKK